MFERHLTAPEGDTAGCSERTSTRTPPPLTNLKMHHLRRFGTHAQFPEVVQTREQSTSSSGARGPKGTSRVGRGPAHHDTALPPLRCATAQRCARSAGFAHALLLVQQLTGKEPVRESLSESLWGCSRWQAGRDLLLRLQACTHV